jgi:signal transduction histidine kinase
MLLGVVFSTLVLLLLAGFLWLVLLRYRARNNQHLKESEEMKAQFDEQLLQSKIEVQEQTFTLLGQELHDNIGQLLSSVKMLLGATQRKLPEVPPTLKEASDTLAKAMQEIRSLSKSLNKEWLDQFHFIENIQTEIERIRQACDVTIELHTNTTFLPLRSESQLLLFRTVQEALVNSLKHAGASEITITIEFLEALTLQVRDNGTGMTGVNRRPNGVGCMNMKNRIALLGGTIEWQSGKEGGTSVHIVLPVQNEFK